MRLIITIFNFVFCLSTIFAQQELSIQTDKAFYVSGEKMGIVISNSTTDSPEIVYFELLDKSGEVLEKLTLKSNGIAAMGIVEIPLDWKSDWYILRTYTIWLPTLVSKDIGYHIVPIYNAFDENPANETIALPTIELPTTSAFTLNGLQTNYQKGMKAEISIKNDAENKTQYSVAVIDENTYALNTFFKGILPTVPLAQTNPAPPSGAILTQPLFLGRIEGEANVALGAFYIAEEGKFDFVSFNDKAIFGVELPDFYGQKHAPINKYSTFRRYFLFVAQNV